MRTVLNILNFVLGGFATTLGWLLATLVSIVLIFTLPLTRSCWEITFFGWWLCLMHIATGIAQCISIIGIPVGIANFKIAAIALWPVGRRVVSVETAQAAREANARRRFE